MTKSYTKEQQTLLDDMYNATGIDVQHVIADYEDVDDLLEKLQELCHEIECIYYHIAMQYLLENDPSLQESLSLAHDMGCTLENLDSETLATLLMQQEASAAIYEYKDELEELFFSN